MRAAGSDRLDLVRSLRCPDAYPERVSRVDFIETHISWLFLTDDRVYKVKKPVDLGFVDFSTLARRRHFCAEEVRLNARISPSMYHGVVPIVQQDGGVRVGRTDDAPGATGTVVEWAVEMDRLPADRMMDRLLARGALDNPALDRLAERLARFHADADTGPDVDPYGTPARLRKNADENFEALRTFTGAAGVATIRPTTCAFLERRAHAFLDANRERLERRVARGRIRDGHGDLHAGNICFDGDRIQIYDCIEFTRRFRCADVAADLAFLAMDLDRAGHRGFAGYLAKRYATVTGDDGIRPLLPYYKTYYAIVRAKVHSLIAADPGVAARQRDAAVADARRYVHLAVGYELPPVLVLMCGLPATGKSHVARHLADPLGAAILRSDVVRKRLANRPPGRQTGDAFGAGPYAQSMTDRTYAVLLDDAIARLRDGRPVVVDAMFSRASQRRRFVDAARDARIACALVHVRTEEATVRERMASRGDDAAEVSDADMAVYHAARDAFESPDELAPPMRIEFAGDGDIDAGVAHALDAMIALTTRRDDPATPPAGRP